MAPLWQRFAGSAGSQAVGVAMGSAVVPSLIPYVQDLSNAAWRLHQSVPILPSILAEGVAQGQVPYEWAQEEATNSGINQARFDVMRDIASVGPGVAQAFNLWRRGEIDEQGFRNALKRAGIEDQWITALVRTKQDHLTPAQVALAIVRSLIADPGFLPVDLDVTGGRVPAYPVSPIDAIDEVAAAGINRERLRVMVGEIGRPMGAESAADSVFRGIINRADFNRAILEGDIRPEWANAIFEHARQIPTARDFLENALRGYMTLNEALNGAQLHGMTRDHATLIYQNQGRPMAVRQITQALSRGGQFRPEPGEITDPYDASIVEGNLKPAYYELAKALRYTLPPPFTMRTLAQTGVWSEAKTAKRLKDAGWIPEDADEAAAAWAKPTADGADSHVAKAKTQLWGTLHTAFLAGDASDALAREKLGVVGVPVAQRDDVLTIWKHEREVTRSRLTPSMLKKAWQKATRNPLTNAPWSRDDVLAELLDRGWNQQDANTFLDLPSGQP